MEIEKIFPDLVSEDSEVYESVNYTGFILHLVEATKTPKTENETLKKEIELLKNEKDLPLQNFEKRLQNLRHSSVIRFP